MNDLVEKPQKSPASRLVRFLKKHINKNAMLLAKILIKKKFYIQSRPAYHIKMGGLPGFDALEQIWSQDRESLETDRVRLYILALLCQQLQKQNMEGAIAEVGVYRGHSAAIFQHFFPSKKLYLFDTFSGFESSDVQVEHQEKLSGAAVGQFQNTSQEIVRSKLKESDRVIFCPGHFPKTAEYIEPGESFSLVHFDADLYQVALATCEYFYPRLPVGGMIIFHDYLNRYTGVQRAISEYFSNRPHVLVPFPDQAGSALLIKVG